MGPETVLDPGLARLLCCPRCRGTLRVEGAPGGIACRECGRHFGTIHGLPDLTFTDHATFPGNVSEREQATYEREHHDARAGTYEATTVRRCGDKTELIAAEWALAFPGPFLDYGCGTGQISRVLKRFHPSVYGFDISPLSVLKNLQENHVVGVVANCLHLPFRDRSFETVCCNGVLHHLTDRRRAVREMTRVTNRFIGISEPTPSSYHRTGIVWQWRQMLKRAVRAALKVAGVYEPWHARRVARSAVRHTGPSIYESPVDPAEISELLHEFGFRVTMLRFWTNIGWNRRSRFKRFLIRRLVSERRGNVFEIRAERPGQPSTVHPGNGLSPTDLRRARAPESRPPVPRRGRMR